LAEIPTKALNLFVADKTRQMPCSLPRGLVVVMHMRADRKETKEEVRKLLGPPCLVAGGGEMAFLDLVDAGLGFTRQEETKVRGDIWIYGHTVLMCQEDKLAYMWNMVDAGELERSKGRGPATGPGK
jgi:hypothetical protein